MRFMRIILMLALILLFGTCKEKSAAEQDFFKNGKKVKTGFIWKKTPVSADDVLKEHALKQVFADDFQRKELGKKYEVQGGLWKIKKGAVFSPEAKNRNLILKGVELPKNSVVELDLWSETSYVDIKFNLYGDGKIHDHGDGYSFIMGGWKNRISVISKLHEHEKNRIENRKRRWKPSKKYHIKVITLDGKIFWFVDGEIFLVKHDKVPLKPSAGYKYLSFANWKSSVYFDNLKIYSIK